MLYDNGQLLSLFSKAYKLTKNELYREVIEKTTNFIEREWLTEEGGFYSALDANSINGIGKLEEGAFYVWKNKELKDIFGNNFPLFGEILNITNLVFGK